MKWQQKVNMKEYKGEQNIRKTKEKSGTIAGGNESNYSKKKKQKQLFGYSHQSERGNQIKA